jgi:hypothetical protein
MKTQIRGSVFETNSSSSHSVTVSGKEMADFGLSKEELRSGVIRIEQDFGFGWAEDKFHDTKTKIAYLLINAAGGAINAAGGYITGSAEFDLVPSLRTRSEQAAKLISFVEKATGCKLEFYADGYVSVDSESNGVGMELIDGLDDGNSDKLRTFLFSRESYLETGNDNSDPYGFGYDY